VEASQSLVAWSKAVAAVLFVRIATIWAICVAFCVMSTDFVFDILPSLSLKLPSEFHIFTSQLDTFSSNHLPTTFIWGHYHVEASFGQCPHPKSMSSTIIDYAIDYASLSAGSTTVKALTSATYSISQRKLYGIFSPKVGKDHSPAVALIEGLEPGQCWAFHGDAGQLGIQLTYAIRILSLVVGHTNISSMASAPKKLILWGLKPTNGNLCMVLQDIDAPSPDFGFGYCGIHLFSIIHKPSRSMLYQNFTITPVSSHYFDQLVVQILENWGHPSFTCIYHIQIYGNI